MHRSWLMVMPVMMVPVPAAMPEFNRLEVEAGDARRHIQSGLALQADRLQSVGIVRATDQEIAAAANAYRRIGADAAIGAGEFAKAEPRGWCVNGPDELRLRGDAEIDADAPHGRNIGLGPPAGALEHAFEVSDGTHDKADILSAAAFEDARLHGRNRLCADNGANERSGGDEENGKSHGLSPRN